MAKAKVAAKKRGKKVAYSKKKVKKK